MRFSISLFSVLVGIWATVSAANAATVQFHVGFRNNTKEDITFHVVFREYLPSAPSGYQETELITTVAAGESFSSGTYSAVTGTTVQTWFVLPDGTKKDIRDIQLETVPITAVPPPYPPSGWRMELQAFVSENLRDVNGNPVETGGVPSGYWGDLSLFEWNGETQTPLITPDTLLEQAKAATAEARRTNEILLGAEGSATWNTASATTFLPLSDAGSWASHIGGQFMQGSLTGRLTAINANAVARGQGIDAWDFRIQNPLKHVFYIPPLLADGRENPALWIYPLSPFAEYIPTLRTWFTRIIIFFIYYFFLKYYLFKAIA